MKKLLPWLVSLLLAITLIACVAFYFWSSMFDDNKTKDPADIAKESVENVDVKPMSADEVVEVTSELIDIQTNLADTDFVVRLSLTFQLDSAKAKVEFDKIKEMQIKPIINRALWVLTPDEMSGTAGKDRLLAGLINAINPVLTSGKLTKVDITNFIMSPV